MNVVHRVCIIALTCLSITTIHAERQYVTAKKEKKSSPAGSIEVAITRPKATPSDNPLISHNTFTEKSQKNKLFFDFSKGGGTNEVEVYRSENKRKGERLSSIEVTADQAPAGSEIIINERGIARIQTKS